MQSRQSILQAYSNQTYDFNTTDAISVCGQINSASISWALNTIPNRTFVRYVKKGKTLLVVDDLGPFNNGFLWITNLLAIKIKFQ